MRNVFRFFLKLTLSTKAFLFGMVTGALITLCVLWNFRSPWKLLTPPILDQLFSKEISTHFQSYATKITGKQSLHVARLEQVEVFERSEKVKALWISLPEMITRAHVPVEYNYYVSLSAPWTFERRNDVLVVHVPELSSSKPAPDISAMELEVVKGSLLRNSEAAKERLRKEINSWLVDHAIENRAKVRDQAKDSIQEFIHGWVRQTTGKELLTPVEIYFPDELATPNTAK